MVIPRSKCHDYSSSGTEQVQEMKSDGMKELVVYNTHNCFQCWSLIDISPGPKLPNIAEHLDLCMTSSINDSE